MVFLRRQLPKPLRSSLAAAIRVAVAAGRGRLLKLFPCHYDRWYSAAIFAAIAAAIRIAAAAAAAIAAAPVSTTVLPCFPLQGLSCG